MEFFGLRRKFFNGISSTESLAPRIKVIRKFMINYLFLNDLLEHIKLHPEFS